jgi:hypothetical protein
MPVYFSTLSLKHQTPLALSCMIVAGQNETVATDENFATDYFTHYFQSVRLWIWSSAEELTEANLYSLRVGLSAITGGEGQDALIAHITKNGVCAYPTGGRPMVAAYQKPILRKLGGKPEISSPRLQWLGAH